MGYLQCLVHVVEGPQHLPQDDGRLPLRERPLSLAEGASFAELEHAVVGVLVFENVVELDDVGVVQLKMQVGLPQS